MCQQRLVEIFSQRVSDVLHDLLSDCDMFCRLREGSWTHLDLVWQLLLCKCRPKSPEDSKEPDPIRKGREAGSKDIATRTPKCTLQNNRPWNRAQHFDCWIWLRKMWIFVQVSFSIGPQQSWDKWTGILRIGLFSIRINYKTLEVILIVDCCMGVFHRP